MAVRESAIAKEAVSLQGAWKCCPDKDCPQKYNLVKT